VNPDVDYDEIPTSTAALNSPTDKGRTLTPKKSSGDVPTSRPLQVEITDSDRKTILQRSPLVPRFADEIPDDKKQEMGKPNQSNACLVQVPPTEVITDDDDPIQSFSSSPSELLPHAVDAVKVSIISIRLGSHVLVQPKPEVSLPRDAGVRSDCLSQTGTPVKSLDATSTAEIMPVRVVSSYINVPHAHYHA